MFFFACPAGERRIYNGVSRAQYCLARCTDAISEFIQGGHGHRVILLDYRGTNFVYSLYVNLQWFILNGLKQKYKYAAIVCNPSVQLYKHPLANVGICSYFICNDYHVVQSFSSLRKNILLHTCKRSLLSGVAGCGRAQRPVFGPWYCTQKKTPPRWLVAVVRYQPRLRCSSVWPVWACVKVRGFFWARGYMVPS